MPKKLLEIKEFTSGTVLNPSERDIDINAASDSLNIDCISEDGALRGISNDKIVTDSTSLNLSVNASKLGEFNIDGSKQLLYYDDSDDKLKLVSNLNDATIATSDVSSTAETVEGIPDFETNNQEIHVGTGSGSTNLPLWAGKVTNEQWGSEVTGVQRELANLKKPGNLPPFDKVIKIGNYFYGAQDQDSKVYAVTTEGEFYDSSFEIFQSIISIAYNNETSFWLLDKISDTTCEIKLVDAGSFEVTQTTSFEGICAKGDDDYDPMLNSSQPDITPPTAFKYSFDKYFNTTGVSPLGGGASFITDMVATEDFIYFLRGSGAQTDIADMIKWRYFFKCVKPTQTGTTTVYDISFRTIHEDTSGTSLPANEDGGFYDDINAGNTDDISVVLEIPFKGLFNGGVAAGIAMNIFPDHSDTNQRVCYYNSYKAGVLEAGTANQAKAILLGSDVDASAPHMHIWYFPDDHYKPLSSDNPGSFSDTLGSTTTTFEKINSYIGSTGTDYRAVYIRKLSDDLTTNIINANGYANLINISQFDSENPSDSIMSAVRYDDLADNTTQVLYNNTSGGYVPFYVSSYSGLNGYGTFQVVRFEAINSFASYEIQAAFPITIDESGSSKTHLFRTSKDISLKKFQYIKINVSDGAIEQARETDISVGFTETGLDAFWNSTGNASKIFYKFSITYDGYQESPLGNAFIYNLSSSDQKRLRLNINLHNIDQLSKRATHLNVYCAVSTDSTSTAPDGFYRLVESLRLDSSWTDNVSDADGTVLPAWSVTKERELLHNGRVSVSYEARVGINEVIDNTLPNYSISTSLNNHLFISKCFHVEINNAKNYLFKSRPYNYSQFDWTKDFLILPTTPTAIQSYMGRIYVFDEDNMYRVEPNNLFIEDALEGTGCINQETIAVSDYGMCFCDEDNIYLHDGTRANPIGSTILRNDINSWEQKTSVKSVVFDSFRKAFIIFFQNGDSENRAWVYSVLRNRWDLWESGSVTAAIAKPNNVVEYVTSQKSASVLYSNGTNLISYLGDSTKRLWDFTTKKLTMGRDTNNKKFNNIKLTGVVNGDLNQTGVGTVDTLSPLITGSNSFSQSCSWSTATTNFTHSGNPNIVGNLIVTGFQIPDNSRVLFSGLSSNDFEISQSMGSTPDFTATLTFSEPWQINQSYTNVSQESTTGTGTGIKCSITTSTNGQPIFTITDAGEGYAIDDEIVFEDPGNTTGTATLVVASLVGNVYAKIDDNAFVLTGSLTESKIPTSNSRGKALQVFLKGQASNVDSIGIIYRDLVVK